MPELVSRVLAQGSLLVPVEMDRLQPATLTPRISLVAAKEKKIPSTTTLRSSSANYNYSRICARPLCRGIPSTSQLIQSSCQSVKMAEEKPLPFQYQFAAGRH